MLGLKLFNLLMGLMNSSGQGAATGYVKSIK